MPRRAVFLDRDGVINRAIVREGKPFPPASLQELEILSDVADALAKLRAAGFLLIVVTNQPDVARGTVSRHSVEAIHAHLARMLPIDEFCACYHDTSDGCLCRKPRPGMLLDSAKKHGIDLSASFMVGDRWRDVEAGKNAGCKTIFVDFKYEEKRPESPDCRVRSLSEAADYILNIHTHLNS